MALSRCYVYLTSWNEDRCLCLRADFWPDRCCSFLSNMAIFTFTSSAVWPRSRSNVSEVIGAWSKKNNSVKSKAWKKEMTTLPHSIDLCPYSSYIKWTNDQIFTNFKYRGASCLYKTSKSSRIFLKTLKKSPARIQTKRVGLTKFYNAHSTKDG